MCSPGEPREMVGISMGEHPAAALGDLCNFLWYLLCTLESSALGVFTMESVEVLLAITFPTLTPLGDKFNRLVVGFIL